MQAGLDSTDRPALPWPYVAILSGEVLTLGALAIALYPHLPLRYELGWTGVASMLVMQLYSLRRRLPMLRKLGPLRAWMDAHIFLGLQGLVLIAYHSAGAGPNANLALLDLALVVTVVLSGTFGRYLYTFLPRSRAGQAVELGNLQSELGASALPAALRRECRGIADLARLAVVRRRMLRAQREDRALSGAQRSAARRAIALASRISAIEVAERWFARWTLFHRPLAFLLLGITSLHVLAHFAYAR